jgi:hypothetical protein
MAPRNNKNLRVHLARNLAVWWPQVEEFADKAMKASDGTYSHQMLIESLRDGHFDLWVVHNTEDVLGFYTTEILQVADGFVVNVPFAAFDNNIRALLFAFEHAEKIAKAGGAVGFKFISEDRRWASLAKRRGFRPRFVEYYKEY